MGGQPPSPPPLTCCPWQQPPAASSCALPSRRPSPALTWRSRRPQRQLALQPSAAAPRLPSPAARASAPRQRGRLTWPQPSGSFSCATPCQWPCTVGSLAALPLCSSLRRLWQQLLQQQPAQLQLQQLPLLLPLLLQAPQPLPPCCTGSAPCPHCPPLRLRAQPTRPGSCRLGPPPGSLLRWRLRQRAPSPRCQRPGRTRPLPSRPLPLLPWLLPRPRTLHWRGRQPSGRASGGSRWRRSWRPSTGSSSSSSSSSSVGAAHGRQCMPLPSTAVGWGGLAVAGASSAAPVRGCRLLLLMQLQCCWGAGGQGGLPWV